MEPLTLDFDYEIIKVAMAANMTLKDFRHLDWNEQAELIAYHKVSGLIEAFYSEAQRHLMEEKTGEQ